MNQVQNYAALPNAHLTAWAKLKFINNTSQGNGNLQKAIVCTQLWPWSSHDCFTSTSFSSNLKVISFSCSTRSWNTLNTTACHQVCLTHGHPGNFSVTMTTFLCTPLPLDCVENVQEDKGKNVRSWEAATDHRQTVATDWPTLTANYLKAQNWCIWDVAYLTNFSLRVLGYL